MNKIINILKKITQPVTEKDKDEEKNNEPQDAFQLVDEVIKQLSRKMQAVYGGRQKELKGKTLLLWITDDGKRGLLSQCHDRLLNAMTDEYGMPVADVRIQGGEPPKGATEISEGTAFEVSEPNVAVNVNLTQQAKIRIHDAKGTLRKTEYTLEATGGRYAIGRDATGDHAISIVGDGTDPKYELNKYVRSHHAYIEYCQGLGFCLFVEKDGTRIFGGSRTQVSRDRGKELIGLETIGQPVPLRNGDVIILGKSVELEWIG